MLCCASLADLWLCRYQVVKCFCLRTMAGNDAVYFTATSGAESTVATGTHQLQGSHSRPSAAVLSTPTFSLQKLLPSRECTFAEYLCMCCMCVSESHVILSKP